MSYSEEDIKQKYILPYLASLGFDAHELTLEKTLRIKFPRRTYLLETKSEKSSARARLDILVTRNGKNLFIVEAKTDSVELTDEDRDQAVQYCRLVDPMAPFAIVTNARTAKMYRSLDKVEVTLGKDGILSYEPSGDLQNLYAEALEHFIGYSLGNLRVFCSSQVDQGMTTLLGSREQAQKKFIPEVFVSSKRLSTEFAKFLTSDKPVFAIVGDSGIGKTCAMCGLAREFRTTHPVLFYRARSFIKDILSTIADDFNWAFSPQNSALSLFKQLDRLHTNTQLLVFVDAIDEWENQSKVELLGEFARHIKDRKIKLILSCRSEPWPQFLNSRGTPSDLFGHVFSTEDGKPGYHLAPFDEEEFTQLIGHYRKFYEFTGSIEREVLKECRHSPFLLRICFEVARQFKTPRLSLTVKQIFDEYLGRVLQRVSESDRGTARRVLLALARRQLESNEEATSESVLRSILVLRFNEDLPRSIFEASILEKSVSGSESYIGFYFKKLRDYLVAFHVERWGCQQTPEFRQSWQASIWYGVRLQAALLFYQLANVDKKMVMDGPYRIRAEKYLALYDSILQRHFPYLRDRFFPHTAGLIGFVGVLDLQGARVVAYGFTVIEQGEEQVKFVPIVGNFWGTQESDLPFLFGAKVLHYRSSTDGFNNINVRNEVIEHEIADQLRDLVRGGALNECRCYYLLLEKALGLVSVLQNTRHGISNVHALSRYLPIKIERIEHGIRYSRAYRQLEHQARQEKIASRTDPNTNSPGQSIHSVAFTRDEIDLIRRQAEEAATSRIPIHPTIRDVTTEHAELLLEEAFVALRLKANALNEVVLPDQDNMSGQVRYVWDSWTEDTLATWIPRFYEMFLSDYKNIVEHNFPTLKQHFELYSLMPGHFFVVVDRGTVPLPFEVHQCRANEGEVNRVIACRRTDIEFSHKTETLIWKDQQFAVHSTWSTSIASIMCPPNYFPFKFLSEFVVLRHQVYSRIIKELPIVRAALKAMI
jgi:hypothetical protein